MSRNSTSVEDRALVLLGSGVPAENVAAALGVDASRISQLLANPIFSEQVTALRYEALQEHNERDHKYDSLEDQLLGKLEKSLPLLMKPRDILAAIQVVNNAKRRGQSAPEQVTNKTTIHNIVLPTSIAATFVVNGKNQVVEADGQELLTIQSGSLLKQIETKQLQQHSQHSQHTNQIEAQSEKISAHSKNSISIEDL